MSAVVLDCADPTGLAEFWSAALGRPVGEVTDRWAELVPAPGEMTVAFQRVARHRRTRRRWPRVPQQVHLDVAVDDLDAAVAAARARGARVLSDVHDPTGSPWQVLEDPAGHPFCFVTTGAS